MRRFFSKWEIERYDRLHPGHQILHSANFSPSFFPNRVCYTKVSLISCELFVPFRSKLHLPSRSALDQFVPNFCSVAYEIYHRKRFPLENLTTSGVFLPSLTFFTTVHRLNSFFALQCDFKKNSRINFLLYFIVSSRSYSRKLNSKLNLSRNFHVLLPVKKSSTKIKIEWKFECNSKEFENTSFLIPNELIFIWTL